MIHHIFVKRRKLRQQNRKRGQRGTYRFFKFQELLIWSKSTLNLFYIFAKVARLRIPHPSRYLQKRLCVEVSTEEGNGQTPTTKSLLLLLASSDPHMKDSLHMKDHHITRFSWSSNIHTWPIEWKQPPKFLCLRLIFWNCLCLRELLSFFFFVLCENIA